MTQDRYRSLAGSSNASPNAIRTSLSLRLLRRDVLLGGIGAMVAHGVAGAPSRAQAATDDPDVARFLDISHCLTDRPHLDPRIGAALYGGIIHSAPARKDQLSRLHDIMASGHLTTASDLAKAAEQADAGLKDVIHDIMVAWYRGVADGKVVVYRSALMFDITRDAIYPKTYAAGGPFYWTTQPPEVARPTGQPALSPSPFVVEPT
ncbi:sorbitol dehydrogenase family protein [Gluconacetobacter sp. Hr-1-5]|uniref:sorbitol dehydrogenase family protein n=1 Tax=Gluconacetobacter sp. Hr-1-5 TaxID=3395370 RepID=UPI003B51B99C